MKISVAMASFNGEKFIKRQIETILHQNLPIDELVISDDGSTDLTLDIINSFDDNRIKLITDNPNHGYAGNFEWAIKHTSGDIIFLADQDDIWYEDKTKKCIECFEQNSDIKLIITSGRIINAEEKETADSFGIFFNENSKKAEAEKYLSSSVLYAMANGMCMCFLSSLKTSILPFPDSSSCHDRWIAFCALCENSLYFLDEKLVGYRIHGNNTSMRVNGIKKRIEKAVQTAYHEPFNICNIALSMLEKLDSDTSEHKQAIENAKNMMDLHRNQVFAFTSPLGAVKLISLYINNATYRANGIKYFITQLLIVIFLKKYIKNHPRSISIKNERQCCK